MVAAGDTPTDMASSASREETDIDEHSRSNDLENAAQAHRAIGQHHLGNRIHAH